MDPIVIIGAGLAGYTLIRELRKLDFSSPVILVTADDGDFYSKPMLSNAFAQGKTPAQLVTTSAAVMAAQLGVTLLPRTRVLRIRAGERMIETSAGDYRYAKLVLALGADPIRPALEGDGAGEVHSVNDLADYAAFRQQLGAGARVAILGAGLIGCEFANDLAGGGMRVTVVDPSPHPLASLLPQAAGRELAASLARLGVAWEFGKTARAVDKTSGGYRLSLNDGSEVAADCILSAIGLRPRTALAGEAGLTVNRGIAVDQYLRTSDPHIHALGDCAEVDGQVRPYVLPIMHAARALAQTLAGQATAVSYPPMPVVVKTPACPVVVQPVARDAAGQWQAEACEDGAKLCFVDPAGGITGFALVGGATREKGEMLKRLAI